MTLLVALLATLLLWTGTGAAMETYCGLLVEPEKRCSPYERHKHYTYPPWIEWVIVARAGYKANAAGVLDRPFPSPYVPGVVFLKLTGRGGPDIEHIVAAAEAHDSGLCAAPVAVRLAFARDPANLTLASPRVNRHQKVDKDAGEWLPEINREWYAETVIRVKRRYRLSIDATERDGLASVLDRCPIP